MAYQVKEIFYTLQGEGLQAGRPAVFCRFAGCNLWNGRAEDKDESSCPFCDTDFVGVDGPGGGTFKTAAELVRSIEEKWQGHKAGRFVVFTGGEPLLQLDEELISGMKSAGFEIAVETNGTRPAPAGIDWLTVSPKTNSTLVQTSGDELKLVFPQQLKPETFANLNFRYFFLSPMWNDDASVTEKNAALAVEYSLANPKWRVSLQRHKLWGIP